MLWDGHHLHFKDEYIQESWESKLWRKSWNPGLSESKTHVPSATHLISFYKLISAIIWGLGIRFLAWERASRVLSAHGSSMHVFLCGFPQNRTLKQGFECKWFIAEQSQETPVGEWRHEIVIELFVAKKGVWLHWGTLGTLWKIHFRYPSP